VKKIVLGERKGKIRERKTTWENIERNIMRKEKMNIE
jgi:hypothetical protein